MFLTHFCSEPIILHNTVLHHHSFLPCTKTKRKHKSRGEKRVIPMVPQTLGNAESRPSDNRHSDSFTPVPSKPEPSIERLPGLDNW